MSEVHAFPARRIPADTLALRLVTMRHELGISQRRASELTGDESLATTAIYTAVDDDERTAAIALLAA